MVGESLFLLKLLLEKASQNILLLFLLASRLLISSKLIDKMLECMFTTSTRSTLAALASRSLSDERNSGHGCGDREAGITEFVLDKSIFASEMDSPFESRFPES
jgi:hypothetical protein